MRLFKKKLSNRRYAIYTLLFLFIVKGTFMSVYAQEKLSEQARKLVTPTTGVVYGTVVDEAGNMLEYATITILTVKDSSLVTGGITNEKGVCIIHPIPWGTYIAKISFIGYSNVFTSSFTLSKSSPIHSLQKQKMQLSQKMIEGVTVKADKEMLQSNLDKKVFNIDKSIAAEGATALEVLENIPSVNVDIEGNVSLRGSSSVTILIDGRPTNLTMDQIPSSMIESVELITNPSARYEPDGVSGIINVVLKKKKESGFNGMISVGSSITNLDSKFYLGRNNISTNINYRYNKINVFANYDFRNRNSHNRSSLNRETINSDTVANSSDTSTIDQFSNSEGKGNSHNLRTGIDYFINKQNTLSFNVSYGSFKRGNMSNTNSESTISTSDIFDKKYTLNNQNNFANQNMSANLFYKHNFNKPNQELTIDLYYTRMWGDNTSFAIEDYSIPINRMDFYNKAVTTTDNNFITGQIDFVTPVGNGGRIETGYKFSMRNTMQEYHQYIGSDTNNLKENISDANNYNYDEYINAAYFIYSNTVKKKFKYQIGLRGELANNVFFLRNVDTNTRSFYPNIFPTLHLAYDINKNNTISLSYSMRVRRPNIFQLNPYVNNSDRFNLSVGNPHLKPELTNSVELGYQYYNDKLSVTTNIFYRHRYQMISRYTKLLNDSVSLTSFQNFDQAQSYGIEAYYTHTLFKWWKINLNGTFYQTLIDNRLEMIDPNLLNDWSWNVRGTFTFILPKDFDIQLTANYNSPMITTGSMGGFGWGGGSGQGRIDQQWSMDIGFKMLFFKKNMTLSLRVSDIFATRKSNIYTYGSSESLSFEAYSFRQRDSRQISLSLSYKINNYRPKKHEQGGVFDEIYEE